MPDGYDVASAEARAGRRGLLDTGPYAPTTRPRPIVQRMGHVLRTEQTEQLDPGPRTEDR